MPRRHDLTGQRFGKLVALELLPERDGRYAVWRCHCDCGGDARVSTKRLLRGTVTNCGCIPKTTARLGPIAEDITGRTFGKLTVLRRADNYKDRTRWLCQCECGNTCIATAHDLKGDKCKSCGCLMRLSGERITGLLHHVDGTCIEWLEKRKHRCDNTSGFRGVYMLPNGKFRVEIGFKKRRYYVGVFTSFDQAVKARVEAEELIHNGFVEAYRAWENEVSQLAPGDPVPALVFEVVKMNGQLMVVRDHPAYCNMPV